MRVVEQSATIISPVPANVLELLERVGRVCYKSESNITEGSAEKFISNVLSRGHEAMIEHFSVSVLCVTDRGISHEIVRHRLASYAQESTRYCCYSKDKFGGEITVVVPHEIQSSKNPDNYKDWLNVCKNAEAMYLRMLQRGISPQTARSVLPTCLKTEIVVTMNLREWRHFFKMRCSKRAHPDMQILANIILSQMKQAIPVLFDNIQTQET